MSERLFFSLLNDDERVVRRQEVSKILSWVNAQRSAYRCIFMYYILGCLCNISLMKYSLTEKEWILLTLPSAIPLQNKCSWLDDFMVTTSSFVTLRKRDVIFILRNVIYLYIYSKNVINGTFVNIASLFWDGFYYCMTGRLASTPEVDHPFSYQQYSYCTSLRR